MFTALKKKYKIGYIKCIGMVPVLSWHPTAFKISAASDPTAVSG